MSYAKYESYKDSGVDWLGKIPSDWDLLKVKNIFRLVMKFAPKNNDCELLSVYTDIGVKPRKELEERGNRATTTDGYLIVEKGDIVVNKLLAWMGAIGLSDYDGVTSPAYDVLKPKMPIEGIFYHLLFRSPQCTSELKRHSRGIMDMRLRLYFDKFGDVVVPYPNIEVQKKIVSFLAEKTAQIDQAIALKQQQIEKLNEYKQIVIQNAVTKGLNPNAPMKNSGVEWIGDIPEHWEVKKLKHFGVIKSGDSVINSNLTDEGLYEVYGGNGFMGFYNKFNIDKESIIIGRVGALCGNVRYIKEKKWITDNALIFKLTSKFKDYEYLALVLEAGNLNRLNTSNAQPLITGTKVVNFSIPIPCEKERCEILNVIKSFSTKYSQAITNYQTQIHRLKEYKNILINQAVTGKIKI